MDASSRNTSREVGIGDGLHSTDPTMLSEPEPEPEPEAKMEERQALELGKVEMFCAFTGVSSHTSHYRPPIQLAATFPYTSLPPYAFTGADRRAATAALARVGWELEAATDLFFEAGMEGLASVEGAGGAACPAEAEDAQAEHLSQHGHPTADRDEEDDTQDIPQDHSLIRTQSAEERRHAAAARREASQAEVEERKATADLWAVLREVARSLADCSDPEMRHRRLMEMVLHMPPDQYATLLAHAGLDEEEIRTIVPAVQQKYRDPAMMQKHIEQMALFNWPGQC